MLALHSKDALPAMVEAREGDTYFANQNCEHLFLTSENQVRWVFYENM